MVFSKILALTYTEAHHLTSKTLLTFFLTEKRIKGIMRILYKSIYFERKCKCIYARSMSYGYFLN